MSGQDVSKFAAQCQREGHVSMMEWSHGSQYLASWICPCSRCGQLVEFKNEPQRPPLRLV